MKDIKIDNKIIDIKNKINNIEDEIDEKKKDISFLEDISNLSKITCNLAQENNRSDKSRRIAEDIRILTNKFLSTVDDDIIEEQKERNDLYSKKDLLEKEIRDYYNSEENNNSSNKIEQ